ncbi:collagen-binding domain-containing protein [Corynebacterium sp. CCM 9203]|uniref:collagen-binding domain-containing protein n=1 Tax=Corynebacterium sp. CCM 9203 TaxID=3057615 RepID=UPI003525EDCC
MIKNSVHSRRLQGALKRMTAVSSALMLGMVTCVVPSVANGADGASTATCEIDPMEDYRPWNVVAFEDLTANAESEGSMGVGGTLSFRETNVVLHPKDIARVKGYDRAIGLVAGKLNLGAPTSGEFKILHGDLILEDREGVEFTRAGGSGDVMKFVVAEGRTRDSRPRVVLNNKYNDTVHEAGAFEKIFGSQEKAQKISAQIAAAADEGAAVEPKVVWEGEGTKVSIDLKPGETNIWSVTPEEISKLTELKFQGKSPNVNSGSTLIVNVVGYKPVTFRMNMAGGRDPKAILWNMPNVTQIYQNGDSIDGSILAPLADLQKNSAHIKGTLVIKGGTLGGSEQHFFPFTSKVKVPCGATPRTGSFSVVKNVRGDYTPSLDEKFRITYTCDDASTTSGVLEVPGDATPVSGPDLPEGTRCTISEEESSADRDGYHVETTYTGNPVSIAADSTSNVQVTNKYTKPVAGFSITKTMQGISPAQPDREFTFRYSCNDPKKTSGDVRVTANGEKVDVVSDAPIGTACVISEDATDAQVTGYALKEPDAQTVTVATALPTAHFVNEYTAVTPGPTPPEEGPTPPEEGPTPPEEGPTPPEEGPTPPEEGPTPPEEEPTPPEEGPTPPEEGPTPPEEGPTPPEEGPTPPEEEPTPPEEEPTPPEEEDPSSSVGPSNSILPAVVATIALFASLAVPAASSFVAPAVPAAAPAAAPTTTAVLPAENQPTTTTAPRNAVLAATGADVVWIVFIAVVAMLLGGLLLASKRRKGQ